MENVYYEKNFAYTWKYFISKFKLLNLFFHSLFEALHLLLQAHKNAPIYVLGYTLEWSGKWGTGCPWIIMHVFYDQGDN